MKNISIWKDNNTYNKDYPQLNDDKNVDVLIIGGGITGISTLYHLKDSKLKVILVEQNKIGMSTTGNSTGKLTYLQNDLIDKIRKSFNDNAAYEYINSQKDAINSIVKVINSNNIKCDLKKVDSFIYTNKEKEIDKVKQLERFLNDNNIKHNGVKLVKSKYSFNVANTYIFHPIKFIYGLLDNNNYPIYENTSIKKIKKLNNQYLCYTEKNVIKAKWVIIASHYPYFSIPFLFPIKASLEKSYLSASKYKTAPISVISYSTPFISIRTYKNYLIYLSNSHYINEKTCDRKNYEELIKKLEKLDMKTEYLWSNIDIITNDGIPYIGKIKDRLLIGTGYNTWGLTNGFLAGIILSDIVMNRANKYTKLFSPNRINSSQIIGSINNIVKSIDGYINGYFSKNKNIIYKKKNSKNIMSYKTNNEEYTVYQNCPHIGCKLIYNEIEKTWDCPCHGSRFNINGKCISSPANKDITLDN